ncbi:hypothetical protein Q5A86_13920 [Staphylococcus aureus]|uniref:hypothetical protein n=1 Tax=Staphylococcus aureus TaxID=1280 RepID=UPI0026ECBFE6|nr:hypothetical protein [Staphylococcus aureus]MDO6989711.1 hypothetical protein [Staphylococcus aureus]
MSKNLDKGLVISTVLNVILCMLLILTMRVESLTVSVILAIITGGFCCKVKKYS